MTLSVRVSFTSTRKHRIHSLTMMGLREGDSKMEVAANSLDVR
jgi:hypothetical protein